MNSTPSRSSASSTMSAPVNSGLLDLEKRRSPLPLGRGLLRSTWWCLLVRARPRLENAKKAKEHYEAAGGLCHVFVHLNEPGWRSSCISATNSYPQALGKVGLPMEKTLAQKLWDAHVVRSAPGEPDLLFVDLHLVHEVTSPQAFEGLKLAGRRVRRPDLTV